MGDDAITSYTDWLWERESAMAALHAELRGKAEALPPGNEKEALGKRAALARYKGAFFARAATEASIQRFGRLAVPKA